MMYLSLTEYDLFMYIYCICSLYHLHSYNYGICPVQVQETNRMKTVYCAITSAIVVPQTSIEMVKLESFHTELHCSFSYSYNND